MSEYTLSNSAAVIDAAISSVAGADATPTAGSQNMVTSSGVKTYVDGTVGVFAGKTITTEATGIENTDNDTSIPTSAAVKDYVASQALGVATVNFSGTLSNVYSGNFSASILYSNIGAVDTGTVITLPTGSYIYTISGSLPNVVSRQDIFLNNLRIAGGFGWDDSPRPIAPFSGFLSNISSVYLFGVKYYSGNTHPITVSNVSVNLIKVS
jgi:hypothetical protein